MTTAGNISDTSGSAVGEHSQANAQNTTINLSNSTIREIQLELLSEINRLSNQIDFVNERISAAIQLTNVRVYDLGKTAERQQAHDESERRLGHAEHVEQHDEVNRRLASLEELMRNATYQGRLDRLLFSAAIILLFLIAIGNTIGWW